MKTISLHSIIEKEFSIIENKIISLQTEKRLLKRLLKKYDNRYKYPIRSKENQL